MDASLVTRRRAAWWWSAALAAALLAGCGGGGGGGAAADDPPPVAAAPDVDAGPATCQVADQRAWLRAWMQQKYLWPAQLRTPDEAAADMDGYFRSMLPQADRFSATQATETYLSFAQEGARTGYGYALTFTDDQLTTLRVRHVEPRSPVAKAGLKRGETIVSIDGHGPAAIAAGLPGAVTQPGILREFVVRDAAGVQRSFNVRSNFYPVTPVSVASVLPLATAGGERRVGYLAYQDFLNISAPDLAAAFAQFAEADVTDLVVDLRYNGGGSVNMARNLASLIAGSGLDGAPFVSLLYNSQQSASNTRLDLIGSPLLLGVGPLRPVDRLVVITSSQTASASELLINGLRPYRSVALVGGTTFGKPYGFEPRDACGTTYLAVNFEAVNSLGQGGYTAGLAPECGVADDLDHALGDPAEGRLAAALALIATGSCPAPPAGAQALRRPLREPPAAGELRPPALLR